LLPKIGDDERDCEDRLKITVDDNSARVRAAVADGATSSAFSGQWAELLVEAYCERPFSDWNDFAQRAGVAAKRWSADVFARDLPWHALERAQAGAAAAVAGVELSESVRAWSAFALGDSCLFHVRSERVVRMLPEYRIEDFGNNPLLISTAPSNNAGLASVYHSSSGQYELGDCFVLATDAASEAILRLTQRDGGIAEFLRALSSGESEAREFIEQLRETNELRDDDVAVVAVKV
jgi:hypothetical protein